MHIDHVSFLEVLKGRRQVTVHPEFQRLGHRLGRSWKFHPAQETWTGLQDAEEVEKQAKKQKEICQEICMLRVLTRSIFAYVCSLVWFECSSGWVFMDFNGVPFHLPIPQLLSQESLALGGQRNNDFHPTPIQVRLNKPPDLPGVTERTYYFHPTPAATQKPPDQESGGLELPRFGGEETSDINCTGH